MELINKVTKTKKYTLNSLKTYNLVMNLRRKTSWGVIRIKEHLEKKGINSSNGAIGGWIYEDKKPFVYRIIKQIPESSRELTREKAYVLGTLCGDGWISTGYRIGLGVCDRDFAEYFKYCLEKVYETKCSIRTKIVKPNKFCKNPKSKHVVSQVSKLIVKDLNRYSNSYSTKEWRVPKQIIEASIQLQSYFIRGFADSEGSVRARKRNTELVLCSGNPNGLKDISFMLSTTYGIKTTFSQRKNGVGVLTTSDYWSLLTYKNYINFTIRRKKNTLEKGLANYKRKGLRKYSPEFKLKAMNLLKQGMKHREIAKLLGTNHTNIYDWEKKLLVPSKEINN